MFKGFLEKHALQLRLSTNWFLANETRRLKSTRF